MVFGPAALYYYLDWEKLDSLPEDVLYFHARYRQQTPAKPGDHVILETSGRGHYAGTVYSVHQICTGWFGEGDDRFYIDGEELPSIRGTGTEDYFGDAWGFREFCGPFHGVSLYEGPMAGDRVTAYRWHLADPVRFTKSLRVTIEHRGSVFDEAGNQLSSSGERPDWVSSVAVWYQTPATTWDERLPSAAKRVAPYRVIPVAGLTTRAKPDETKKEMAGLIFRPGVPDGEIEFDFDVAEPGRYRISAMLIASLFGSRYQPMLDGEPLGPVLDMYCRGFDWTEYNFDLHDLQKGTHTLKLAGRGASPHARTMAPKMFAVGINSLILLRLEDMEGYEPP
jgi:hypothetical protein